MRKSSVLAMLLAGTSMAFALDASSDRKAMDQMCKGFANALRTKNASWFDKVAAPDFSSVDHGRKMDRAATLGEVKAMFGMMKSISSSSSRVVSCKSVGHTVVVVTESKMSGVMVGPKGKTSKLVDTSTQEETWMKGPHGWQIHLLKSLTEKATLDGKPFSSGG